MAKRNGNIERGGWNIRRWVILLAIAAVLAAAALATGFTSDLNPFSKQYPRYDSSIFLYFGRVMQHGGVFYRDVFDHKGPLLFFIEYVGVMLRGERGVWLLELVALFLFYMYTYRTARLAADRFCSLLVVLLTVPLASSMLERGNLTEEFALPFIACSLYQFLRYLRKPESVGGGRILLTGLCFTCVFFLRANMIAVWIAFLPVITVDLLRRKETRRFLTMAAWFTGGVVLAAAPTLLYFAVNQALGDMIYQAFTFNATNLFYVENGLDVIRMLLKEMLYGTLFAVVIFYAAVEWRRYRQGKGGLYLPVANLLFLILAVGLALLSWRPFSHYCLVLLPAVVYPAAVVLRQLRGRIRDVSGRGVSRVLLGLSVALIALLPYLDMFERAEMLREPETILLGNIAQDIRANSEEDDLIYTHYLACSIYMQSERFSATRYAGISPEIDWDHYPEITAELLSDLREKRPLFIVTDKEQMDSENNPESRRLDRELSSLVQERYTLFQEYGGWYRLYRLNE